MGERREGNSGFKIDGVVSLGTMRFAECRPSDQVTCSTEAVYGSPKRGLWPLQKGPKAYENEDGARHACLCTGRYIT